MPLPTSSCCSVTAGVQAAGLDAGDLLDQMTADVGSARRRDRDATLGADEHRSSQRK
jgi:hypothetical protein